MLNVIDTATQAADHEDQGCRAARTAWPSIPTASALPTPAAKGTVSGDRRRERTRWSPRCPSGSDPGTWRLPPTEKNSTSRADAPTQSPSSTPTDHRKIAEIPVGDLPWGVAIREVRSIRLRVVAATSAGAGRHRCRAGVAAGEASAHRGHRHDTAARSGTPPNEVPGNVQSFTSAYRSAATSRRCRFPRRQCQQRQRELAFRQPVPERRRDFAGSRRRRSSERRRDFRYSSMAYASTRCSATS